MYTHSCKQKKSCLQKKSSLFFVKVQSFEISCKNGVQNKNKKTNFQTQLKCNIYNNNALCLLHWNKENKTNNRKTKVGVKVNKRGCVSKFFYCKISFYMQKVEKRIGLVTHVPVRRC